MKINLSKNAIIGIVLILIIIFIYWYFFSTKSLPDVNKSNVQKAKSNASNIIPPVKKENISFPLKSGSNNSAVKYIQHLINQVYIQPNSDDRLFIKVLNKDLLTEDGAWGPKTQAAVEKYLGVSTIDETLYNNLASPAYINDILKGFGA